ncbi:MAG: hypothetical protein GXP22_02150 [Gammaproteobacteria bacterium]|nr:hypothetical protein [Gammaproteobacteria bacterium]
MGLANKAMIERIYRFFMIEAGERERFSHFLLIFTLLGCGMSLGRGSAEAMFFKRFGIENLPYTYVLLGLALFVVCLIYASIVDRISSEKLLKNIINILLAVLLLCWLVISFAPHEGIYPIYYLLYEITSEIILIHSTLYLSQNLDSRQIKRLIPIILGGMQLGAILGGSLLAISAQFIAVEHILLLWVITLIITRQQVQRYHTNHGTSPYFRPLRRGRGAFSQALQQISEGLSFARYSTLLKFILLALFFMVISFYILHYASNRIYIDYFTDEASLTSFYGGLSAITGIIALFFQLFITNKLIHRKGIRLVNLIFPVFITLSFLLFNFSYALPAALFASFSKDSIMPGFRNPVHNLFYNALPARLQGRSRALGTGLILPLALICAGLFLYLTQQGLSAQSYLIIGLLTSSAYFLFALKMNKNYASALISSLRNKLFIPDREIHQLSDDDSNKTFDILCRATQHAEPDIRFSAAIKLLKINPQRAISTVLESLTGMDMAQRDQLIKYMMPLRIKTIRKQLWSEIRDGDEHLRSTSLRALFNLKDNTAKSMIRSSIRSNSSRIRTAGIFGALHYPIESLQQTALDEWKELLESENKHEILAGLDLLTFYPRTEFSQQLKSLILVDNYRIQLLCVNALSLWPEHEIEPFLLSLQGLAQHSAPEIRKITMTILGKINANSSRQIVRAAFEDEHPDVRTAAVSTFFSPAYCNINIVDWLLSSQASPRAQSSVLNTLIQREPELPVLRRIAYKKAKDAAAFFAAKHTLTNTHPSDYATRVLQLLLDERASQLLDLSLYAVSLCEDPTAVAVIRAGLISNDQQHYANALEVLECFSDQSLSQLLLSILNNMKHDNSMDSNKEHPLFTNLHDIIQWCQTFDDPWLFHCANKIKTQEPASHA